MGAVRVTVIPGAYQPRPAHIHYKVLQNGKTVLTSQMYFKEPDKDEKLPSLTTQIDLQTVDLKQLTNGEFEAFFRIVL